MDEFKKQVRGFFEKIIDTPEATVTQYQSDEGDLIGILVATDYKKVDERIKENVLASMNFDVTLLRYLEATTPEEREKMMKLAKLKALKDAVAKLESELIE